MESNESHHPKPFSHTTPKPSLRSIGGDNKLFKRVSQLIQSNPSWLSKGDGFIAEKLRDTYPEYKRKPNVSEKKQTKPFTSRDSVISKQKKTMITRSKKKKSFIRVSFFYVCIHAQLICVNHYQIIALTFFFFLQFIHFSFLSLF